MRRRQLLGWILPVVIVAAIAVYVGGVASGHWRTPKHASGAGAPYPQSTDPEQRKAQTELCPLINRPELLQLVERPATVEGTGTSYSSDADWHECTVTLPHSTLRLNVWHGHTRIADYMMLFPEAQPRTVLRRPACWSAGPSIVANSKMKESTLLVAWDRGDTGGMVELTIARETLDPRDESALTQIAQRQLPSLPNWPG